MNGISFLGWLVALLLGAYLVINPLYAANAYLAGKIEEQRVQVQQLTKRVDKAETEIRALETKASVQ